MAEDFTPLTLSNINNQVGPAVTNINANFQTIATLLQDVLSRSGVTPNQMLSQLDMNGQRILNLPAPGSQTDPVRVQDLGDIQMASAPVSVAMQPVVAGSIANAQTLLGISPVSTAMAPVVDASSLALGRLALGTLFFSNRTAFRATTVPSSTVIAVITGYLVDGDSPPRWMARLASTPSPVQPWHEQTADGGYWQDIGAELYMEFYGGQANNPSFDNATAASTTWSAHLNLGKIWAVLGETYYFASNVILDLVGFRAIGFHIQGSGRGRSYFFWPNVTSPANAPQFTITSTDSGSVFFGGMWDMKFRGNCNAPAVQLGDNTLAHAFNNIPLRINCNNSNTSSNAQALAIYSWLGSTFDIVANGGGIATGKCALSFTKIAMNTGTIAVGQSQLGIAWSNSSKNNYFTNIDIEVCTNAFQCNDATCAQNRFESGIITGDNSGTQWAIDNSGSGALSFGKTCLIVAWENLFKNPTTNDNTWGGNKTIVESQGTTYDQEGTPSIASATWFLNDMGHTERIYFHGTGTIVSIAERFPGDYSTLGTSTVLSSPLAAGYYYLLGPGSSIFVTYTGTVAWLWIPAP